MSRRSRSTVLVLDARDAVPDYVAMLGAELTARDVDCVVVAGPTTAARAGDLRRSAGRLRVVPAFRLVRNGGRKNLRPYLGGWVRTAALIVRLRPDVLHIQWLVLPRLEAILLPIVARLARVRLVHTVHNVVPHEPADGDVDAYARWYARCDALVVHTRASKDDLLARWPALDPSRVHIAPHGNFDPLVEALDAPSTEADDRPLFVCFGGMRRYKGFVDAVRAFARANESSRARLVVAGRPDDPVYAEEIRKAAAEAGTSDIVVDERYLAPRDLLTLLRRADGVLMPYRRIDQSGVLLLAMTLGKAIVATALPSFVETVGADRRAALLCETGDVDALADAIRDLASKPSLRTELGARAREAAERNHGWDRVVSCHLKAYSLA